MNNYQKNKFLKSANLLELIPVRNYEFCKEKDEIHYILIPKFKSKLLNQFLIPNSKSKNIKIKLDGNGASVWQLIDGFKTVDSICNQLTNDIAIENQDFNDRIYQFILKLYKQGLINFTVFQKF